MLDRFRQNPPADPMTVDAIAAELPDDYKDFLRRSNGGEGFLDNGAYAVLWKAEEIVPFNAGYEAPKYVPEALFFGPNGGGEGYAFDLRKRPFGIVQLPFIGMAMKEAWFLTESFASFLNGSWVVGEE